MLPVLSVNCRRHVNYVTSGATMCCRRSFWGRLKKAESATVADDSVYEATEETPVSAPLDEQARTKSRLLPIHRRHMMGQQPDWQQFAAAGELGPEESTHHAGVTADWRSLDRQRQLWAMYGSASGIDPAICWPGREECEDLNEYEALACPDSLQTMVERDRTEREQDRQEKEQRMREIEENLAKLDGWKREIIRRKNRQIEEVAEAEARRAETVAEIRDMFGFNIDKRDPRFIEALEQREEVEKKEARAQKKKRKAERLAQQISQGIENVKKQMEIGGEEEKPEKNDSS